MSELADFVLNTIRHVGGIVEPPAYDIYDVLLPEEVAGRWGISAYQRLAFDNEPPAEAADVTVVGYGHPLVERLIEESQAETACTLAAINDVRLDKRGLAELARKTVGFPNARLAEIPRQGESPALCHYVRFNFKAAMFTDEKREQLVSVLMDAQAGFAVPELRHIEQLALLEEESTFGHLSLAPVRWLPGQSASQGDLSRSGRPGRVHLTRPVLDGLLERATRAALDEMAAPLDVLRRLAARHLELDLARLTAYYDDIARDLQRRLDRTDDPARRAGLQDKLAAAQSEREAKLADVEAKYRLSVELELINLQVITQPKILLPVQIGNRATQVERVVVWDPLLHRIEPLACDVCGRSATRLTLCSGGHLAHDECLLAEQCVDCKRAYCRLCADQMTRCIVCQRPVCMHSLNRCATCGRGTCREHVGLCHAADGQPAVLAPARSSEPPPPSLLEKAEEPPTPPAPPAPPRRSEEKKRKVSAPPTPARAASRLKGVSAGRPGRASPRDAEPALHPIQKPPAAPPPYRIEVHAEPGAPVVNAFVLTKSNKQIAVRSWTLSEQGIAVTCHCEKWMNCPAKGMMLKPAGASGIVAQIEEQIEELRQEYSIPARRVLRYIVAQGAPRQVPRLLLGRDWKGE
jgi:hypothetical protein